MKKAMWLALVAAALILVALAFGFRSYGYMWFVPAR